MIAPPLGRGGVLVRSTLGLRSCGHNASPLRSSDREQDHVIDEAGGHELEAPNPDHHGACNQ